MLLVATEVAGRRPLHCYSWVVSWRHYLGFVLEEVVKTIHVEVFRWCALALWTTAVEEAFVGEDLRAVHVQSSTQLDETILRQRCHDLLVLYRLVDLDTDQFELTLLSPFPFVHAILITLQEI